MWKYADLNHHICHLLFMTNPPRQGEMGLQVEIQVPLHHHEPALCYACHMQLNDDQRDTIIAWAVRNPLVRAVLLYDSQVEDTEEPHTDVDLALSMDHGPEETWRLANFISHRRAWTAELETALGLMVQLELANRDHTPDAGYVELWRA